MAERDAVQADPKHYIVEAEDDRIRVLRIRYRGGEKLDDAEWQGGELPELRRPA